MESEPEELPPATVKKTADLDAFLAHPEDPYSVYQFLFQIRHHALISFHYTLPYTIRHQTHCHRRPRPLTLQPRCRPFRLLRPYPSIIAYWTYPFYSRLTALGNSHVDVIGPLCGMPPGCRRGRNARTKWTAPKSPSFLHGGCPARRRRRRGMTPPDMEKETVDHEVNKELIRERREEAAACGECQFKHGPSACEWRGFDCEELLDNAAHGRGGGIHQRSGVLGCRRAGLC